MRLSNLILGLFFGCNSGLYPLNNSCPGGNDCWCEWDTGHQYYPLLDEFGNIMCDTGEE